MFHSLKAKTAVMNLDSVTTTPIFSVLKKSVFRNRDLQRFIASHMNLLCKCSLDGKGMYKWASQLTREPNVSSTESWWKSLSAEGFDSLQLFAYYTWELENRLTIECVSVFCIHSNKAYISPRSSYLYVRILFLAMLHLNAVKQLVCYFTRALLCRILMVQFQTVLHYIFFVFFY